MMPRAEVLKRLAALRTDEIVVTTMMTSREWPVYSDHQLDFDSSGTGMGHATDMALGLALAHSERRVVVFNGDGSMLMNLGQLVTIAQQAPPNLVVIVFQNDMYEVTGGQPIPGTAALDFAGMARAAGIVRAYDFSELKTFEEAIPKVFREPGPVFVNLRVTSGTDAPPAPRRSLPERARRLMEVLGHTASTKH
jgi:thiamine pyrophosphate-dependent acetolactate synthase large subunit-like protein